MTVNVSPKKKTAKKKTDKKKTAKKKTVGEQPAKKKNSLRLEHGPFAWVKR